MGFKDKTTKLAATGAGIALASCGLSNGNDNGPVDPAPDPLQCSTVGEGETLSATGVVENSTTLKVTVENDDRRGYWHEAEVIDPVGATVEDVQIPEQWGNEVEIILTLDSASTTTGSFTLQGKLIDNYEHTCDVSRTFTFSIGAQIEIAALGVHSMPLSGRHRTQIAMIEQDGREVELEAKTTFQGPQRVAWTVNGGEIVARAGSRVRWRLPAAKGFYQAQVVVDCGGSGIAFDALSLEVT